MKLSILAVTVATAAAFAPAKVCSMFSCVNACMCNMYMPSFDDHNVSVLDVLNILDMLTLVIPNTNNSKPAK